MKDLSSPPALIRAAETLDELALVINSTYAAAEEATRKGLERYREVGLMLVLAKKKCAHGEWLPWLKANVKFSERHARRYIELTKSDTVSDLEGAWRAITGRDEPEQEPERPLPGAGAPFVETVGTDGKDYFVGARKDGTPWVMPKEREAPPEHTPKAAPRPEPADAPELEAEPPEVLFDRDEYTAPPESEPEPAQEEPAEPDSEPATVPFEKWHASLPTHEELERLKGLNPGSNVDPDHPFAKSLRAMTALVRALNEDMEADETGFLKDNLSLFARMNAPLRMVLHRSGHFRDGKQVEPCAKFVGLVLLRAVVRDTGKRLKKMTPKQVRRLIADISNTSESDLMDKEDAA